MKFRIRCAELGDLDTLEQLWLQWMDEIKDELEIPLLPEAGTYFRNIAGTGIITGASPIYVAETQEVQGFILGQTVTPQPPFQPETYGYINYLYIRPEARGQGLGQSLVRSLMASFVQRGLRQIEIHVYAANEQGYRFWQKIGMTPLGHRMGCRLNAAIKTMEEKHG